MAFARGSGWNPHVIHRTSIHHAQKVVELCIMKRVVEGVVVDEVFGVRSDDSVGVLCEASCLSASKNVGVMY